MDFSTGSVLVISLWVMGFFATRLKNGMSLGIGAFILGFLVLIVGGAQQQILPGGSHWVIQVVHLLLGLGAIGMGEAINGRARRSAATQEIVA